MVNSYYIVNKERLELLCVNPDLECEFFELPKGCVTNVNFLLEGRAYGMTVLNRAESTSMTDARFYVLRFRGDPEQDPSFVRHFDYDFKVEVLTSGRTNINHIKRMMTLEELST